MLNKLFETYIGKAYPDEVELTPEATAELRRCFYSAFAAGIDVTAEAADKMPEEMAMQLVGSLHNEAMSLDDILTFNVQISPYQPNDPSRS